MYSINDTTLESNKYVKINFAGGELSSDAGLLLIKEFISKMGFDRLLSEQFQTNDSAVCRTHKDDKNLFQVIYQTIAAYFEDDCADELTNEPVFATILSKDSLASQPTLSRFYNRMDGDTLEQFNEISRMLRNKIYFIEKPKMVLMDLDSTLLETYGKQELKTILWITLLFMVSFSTRRHLGNIRAALCARSRSLLARWFIFALIL